jgi:hypothetical protein
MALTLDVEQRLDDVNLTAFFNDHEDQWSAAVQECYDYVKKTYKGAPIRPDDVAKFLRPAMDVDEGLRDELSRRKLKQKYWVHHFTDLIIERTWGKIRR